MIGDKNNLGQIPSTFLQLLVQLRGDLPDQIPVYEETAVRVRQQLPIQGPPSEHIEPENKQCHEQESNLIKQLLLT